VVGGGGSAGVGKVSAVKQWWECLVCKFLCGVQESTMMRQVGNCTGMATVMGEEPTCPNGTNVPCGNGVPAASCPVHAQ